MQWAKYLVSVLVCVLASQPVVGKRGGGGGGGGRGVGGGRSSGGWFSSSSNSRGSSSVNSQKSNSYPKQQWGTSSNTGAGKPANTIGGGGFVNPRSNYGSSAGRYGSNYGHSGSAPSYSYRSPGYGTNFGTNFGGGVGRFGGSGFPRKSIGMGVGAGFLGGTAVGLMTGVAVMSVYHRYHEYRRLMYMHQYGQYNDPYYNNYYSQGRCFGGCPMNSHCEYGFCECNNGFTKGYGRCYRNGIPQEGRSQNFDPFQTCAESKQCFALDMNLICNTNLTTGGTGRCECRNDFKWNTETGECNFYLDVDCSNITYDTKPSPVILEAANITMERIKSEEIDTESLANSTVTIEDSLENSLLSNIDPGVASQDEIREAFCRDVDSFSWEFAQPQTDSAKPVGTQTIGIITFIVLCIIACCLGMLVCKFLKKIQNCCVNSKKTSNNERGKIDNVGTDPSANTGLIANPGYQAQPTPLHLQYPIQPLSQPFEDPNAEPAPIPPTQPGYTNSYPPIEVYPQIAYPIQPNTNNFDNHASQPILPYPVHPGPPLYPQIPYPPVDPAAQQIGYPLQAPSTYPYPPPAYPPVEAQPIAGYPTYPPAGYPTNLANPPPYNPYAPTQ